MKENIFYISEKNGNSAGNNSDGHFTSIHAGGQGRNEGDRCQANAVPINAGIPAMVCLAIVLIFRFNHK